MIDLSLMTLNMFMPVMMKIMLEHDMEDALELQEEMLDLVAGAGFDAVDVTSLEIQYFGIDEVKRQLEKRGLKASSLIHFNQFATMDPEKGKTVVEEGRKAVDQAKQLGAAVLMLVPQAQENIREFSKEEIHNSLVAHIAPVTEYAKEQGIHSVIEDTPDLALSLCSAEDVSDILENIPGQEFVYDSGNMILEGEDPTAYYDMFAGKTAYIHLKDMQYVPMGTPYADTARDGRQMSGAPSGTGIVDFPELISRIKASGYEGYATVEFVKDEDLSYEESLARAKRFFMKLLEE